MEEQAAEMDRGGQSPNAGQVPATAAAAVCGFRLLITGVGPLGMMTEDVYRVTVITGRVTVLFALLFHDCKYLQAERLRFLLRTHLKRSVEVDVLVIVGVVHPVTVAVTLAVTVTLFVGGPYG